MTWPYRWLFIQSTGKTYYLVKKKIFVNKPENQSGNYQQETVKERHLVKEKPHSVQTVSERIPMTNVADVRMDMIAKDLSMHKKVLT